MGAMQTEKTAETYVPRPLAEHMEPMAAWEEMQHYEARRNPEGLFRSAWNYTEYGLNQNIECDMASRRYYFNYAQNLIGMTLKHPKARQDTVLGGLVLSTYIPLFQKRSFDQSVTSDDCYEVYESLGKAMRHMQPLHVDQPPQWRMAETAVLALAARKARPELLLYPSSPREETSHSAALNHDSYFINHNTKIPIQQKLIETGREYDEWITVLTLQPLIEQSFRKSRGHTEPTLADQVNYLLSLIVAETNGQQLQNREAIFLDTLSTEVALHRWKRSRDVAA